IREADGTVVKYLPRDGRVELEITQRDGIVINTYADGRARLRTPDGTIVWGESNHFSHPVKVTREPDGTIIIAASNSSYASCVYKPDGRRIVKREATVYTEYPGRYELKDDPDAIAIWNKAQESLKG